jgi:hypothetical protein
MQRGLGSDDSAGGVIRPVPARDYQQGSAFAPPMNAEP